jgi:head-tail adaptor
MTQEHLEVLRTAHARVAAVTYFTVERATRASDGAGGQTIVWNTVASGHGTFKQNRSTKQNASERLTNVSGVLLVCAYDVDVKPTDRVRAKDFSYDVLAVDMDTDELLVRNVTLESR